jgi:hypothetical protein
MEITGMGRNDNENSTNVYLKCALRPHFAVH